MTLSLCSILAEPAARFPDRTAVLQGERRISYAHLWQQARRYAAALRELGVVAGDRVALLAPNIVEFPVAYYAIAALGAVVVPVHLLLNAEGIDYVLRDSGARVLVAAGTHEAVACAAAAATTTTVAVAGAGGGLHQRAEELEPVASFVARAADDPAVIFYTSGTTGAPKGAVLTQLNMVMNATVNAFDSTGATPDDIVLGCLPLFHSFGQTVAMNTTFRRAATLVLQPRFDAAQAIELMVAERVSVFLGVPTMFIGLLAAAREATELPALAHCVSGGDSLPVSVLERFNTTFATTVYEGYGLSETSPSATVNQPAFGTRAGTVGHPLWGVEVEVARAEVDDRVELVAADELGEIVIRGHNVFAGYLNRPEETAAVLQDGWLRTGDLGSRDTEGFIRIVDRKKDLIIRGGFNVYPREIEEALLRHPGVDQVAVIGLADETYGEEICAVVVRTPDSAQLTGAELIDWARENLGRHQYPRRVEFLATLPLGPSMKVLKRELRSRFA